MSKLRAAAIRAARTAAQAAIAAVPGSAQVFGEVDWAFVGGSALLMAVMSALTSLVTDLPEAA